MFSKALGVVAAAAMTVIASPANAVANACLVDISVVGFTIQGWHDINVNTPAFNDWDYYVRRLRGAVVKDSATYHDPDSGQHFTSAAKVNCVIFRAQTEADFESSTLPDEHCLTEKSIKVDVVPPQC